MPIGAGAVRQPALPAGVSPQVPRITIRPPANSMTGLLKTIPVASAIPMDELLRRTHILFRGRFPVLELRAVAALGDDDGLGPGAARAGAPLRSWPRAEIRRPAVMET